MARSFNSGIPTERTPKGHPRVLIVRPTALGDVSRTVPVLVTLRRAMPQAHIQWLVADAFADVVRHHPDLDGVVVFPRKRFGSVWRNRHVAAEVIAWCGDLRRAHHDHVFDLQGLFRSGLFTWITGAQRRVGFADARELGWLGYNRRHRIDDSVHAVDRMLALVRAEGFEPCDDTRLYVGQDDQRWLADWQSRHGVTGPYACLAPTARWRCKCWPIDRYVQIAQRMLDTAAAGDRLVVLAAPHEKPQIQPLLAAFEQDGRVLFPQTTVGQMMAILSRTRLLVCNDSAPLHIAVGFNRPIVAIFGPTDPAVVGPYHRDDTVVRPSMDAKPNRLNYRHHRDDQSLVAQVTVGQVWEKLEEQLAR